MSKTETWNLGYCSWCVGDDISALVQIKRELNITSLHLSLLPVIEKKMADYTARIKNEGFAISATMVGFPQEDYSTLSRIKETGGIALDAFWDINRGRVLEAIKLTSDLNVKYLSLHFGYIDPGPSQYADKLFTRVRLLADAALDHNIMLLMETGQETADQLSKFIEILAHPAIGVNFDPGNMILYGMGDPAQALDKLAPYIKHVHVKDALPSQTPGQWGTEMPWGLGAVGNNSFLKKLADTGFRGGLAIEREVGESKLKDVKTAAQNIRSFILGYAR